MPSDEPHSGRNEPLNQVTAELTGFGPIDTTQPVRSNLQSLRERTCESCDWFRHHKSIHTAQSGNCHLEPTPVIVSKTNFCSHYRKLMEV